MGSLLNTVIRTPTAEKDGDGMKHILNLARCRSKNKSKSRTVRNDLGSLTRTCGILI